MTNYVYVNLISQSTYCMLDENGEEQGEKAYSNFKESIFLWERIVT
jgi:hypothetical protein